MTTVSIPLGLNFGWAGGINLQCAIEKLFAGAFGISYPPEDAEMKIQDTLLLKKIKRNVINYPYLCTKRHNPGKSRVCASEYQKN